MLCRMQVVPNANFINLGGFSQAFIRGVGNTSQGAAIGGETNISFYLDGVYLERGMGANTEFFDVERIEVLRGPQGTLYGRNATGGAVNIITRMPTDEVDFKAGVTVGNYDKIRADASLAGPIVSGKVAGRISASINKHDGYVKNLIGPDLQDENSYGIRGKLSITPSDSIRIDLAADYYEQNNNGTVNQLEYDPNNAWPTLTAPVPEDFWSANVNGPVYDNAESYGLSATIAIDLPHDMTFRSITAYRNWERDFLWDADNNLPARVDLVLHDYFDTFTQEVQLDGKLDRLSWQTGFFYYELDNQWGGDFYFDALLPGLVRSPELDLHTKAWAAFLNITLAVSDRLNVNAGIRYSDERKHAITTQASTIPPSVIVRDTKGSWDDWSPKVSIDYSPSDDVMLYASVSKGFRAGQIADNNPPPYSRLVNPEKLWAYEVGAKTKWADDRVRANVTAFYYDYQDLQQTTVIDAVSVVTNASSAEIKGVELEMTAMVTSELTLFGNFSYMDSEYKDFVDVSPYNNAPVDVSGNRLRYAPKTKAMLGASYDILLGNSGTLTLRGDVSFIGDIHFSSLNTDDLKQDSYTLVNANMTYRNEDSPWSVMVYGKNLTKEKYYRHKSLNSFVGRAPGGYVGDPRTYGLQVIYQY